MKNKKIKWIKTPLKLGKGSKNHWENYKTKLKNLIKEEFGNEQDKEILDSTVGNLIKFIDTIINENNDASLWKQEIIKKQEQIFNNLKREIKRNQDEKEWLKERENLFLEENEVSVKIIESGSGNVDNERIKDKQHNRRPSQIQTDLTQEQIDKLANQDKSESGNTLKPFIVHSPLQEQKKAQEKEIAENKLELDVYTQEELLVKLKNLEEKNQGLIQKVKQLEEENELLKGQVTQIQINPYQKNN